MKLPFMISFILCIPMLVMSQQETFIKSITEGNFSVNPYMIEKGLQGPVVCGFKSKRNPDRSYFFCDEFDEFGNKIKTDSLLYSTDFYLFSTDDNRPTRIDNKLFWFRRSNSGHLFFSIDLTTLSITRLDTINFDSIGFYPNHLKYIAENQYFLAGFVNNQISETEIFSDLAIAKVDEGQIDLYVEKKEEETNDLGRYILKASNDTIRVLSNFIRSTVGIQVSEFDFDLNKTDSLQTDIFFPRIGRIYDGLEDSRGGYAFVSRSAYDFDNLVSYISKDGSEYWNKEIGHNLNAGNRSKLSSIIESHDKKGFVFVGSDLTVDIEVDSFFSYAVVGKISRDGETEWYRKYKLIDSTYAEHEFYDITYANDGGYYLTGKLRSFDTTETEPVKLILAKVDSMGRIDDYTNIESTNISSNVFSIAPNPFTNQINLSQTTNHDVEYKIFNLHGVMMDSFKMSNENQDRIINTQYYPPGMYFIKAFIENELIKSEKVLKIE